MDNTKKNPNVPNLRFSNTEAKWEKYKVCDLLKCISTNSLTWNELSYNEKSSIKNIHYGLIHNGFSSTCITCDNQLIPYVIKNNLPKQYVRVEKGNLILADASEDRKDVGRAIEIIETNNKTTISGLHTIHAKDISNLLETGFKGYYFNSIAMKKQIHRIANGSKIYSISPSNFNELYISIPNKHEQTKIVSLLSLIEHRIETQNKIINENESYINALKEQMLIKFSNNITFSVGEVCSITTGKLDANAMKENGKYRFYTCAEKYYYIDEYSFDTEALLISGNGANVGYIHYYNGKFNAYQRTYILSNFKINPLTLKLNLDVNLKKRIEVILEVLLF